MKEILYKYMAKHTNLREAEQEAIINEIVVERFLKGTDLTKQGYRLDTTTDCYFVLAGCVRQFYIDEDGKEITSNFYTEEQAILLANFGDSSQVSNYSLTCVEDSVLVVSDMVREEEMYLDFPELETMTRRMMEGYLGQTQNELAQFFRLSPEERYKSVITNRPDLITRVPQHQLASYLGITPESLSRIKKRIQ
ncbi:Crp/Fnr family transcriptional regulator [Ornithinibacillus sp. BX22]|uniref:Crp/Fnr family transcriptional regulator n=2 Tax=Ornithinibacillus TaxID=484508 RepID=A0A923L7U6_9BACI|nr:MULTISPECIES: Crp/Fnr family transcriptional regulator [Ornithinibacillus]MBC5638101.1 Crp/Fnr family transcriptional regulator [Ornithinibacillus hominis]MBS3680828.1 Crp/Fnr family transcriptional regulator [Ornithinibacillus massiliensis]